jgi:hypothetical protein
MQKLMFALLIGIAMNLLTGSIGYCSSNDVKDTDILVKMEFIEMSQGNNSHKKIFAKTTLVLVNNTESSIFMGKAVSFPSTGKSENVGIDISLCPQIQDHQIVIKTKMNISYISTFDKSGNPIIQRSTSVADLICKNNETILLGGLIGEKKEDFVFVKLTPEIQNP